jgi:hypothetical protein
MKRTESALSALTESELQILLGEGMMLAEWKIFLKVSHLALHQADA